MRLIKEEIRLKGLPICRGIAIGKPFFFHLTENNIPHYAIEKENVEKEVLRYREALAKARDDIICLKKELGKEHVVEGVQILDAELQMMQDPLLTEDIEDEIRSRASNAESIFQETIDRFQKRFEMITDPLFQERFKDIQDIAKRVLSYLLEKSTVSLSDVPPESIVFAKELTTADIAEANHSCVLAFVSHFGGSTSHAAIVAKAKGIPYVTSIEYEPIESFKDSSVILDGRTGEIIVNPDDETLALYQALKEELDAHRITLRKMQNLPPETYDGYKIGLSANVESLAEIEMLHRFGGHGVGLFRSEFAFPSERNFPSEEDQFALYSSVVKQMAGRPIVIRTFDVGGDKFLGNELIAPESNPYLGCRAIRFLLKESGLFKAQLRAILRASVDGNVSIMFPMISSLQELLEVKGVIHQVQEELVKQYDAIPSRIRIGCMIEVPSAALICDLLAKECDFMAIGTNDLIQYALAVDRGNHLLSGLYAPTHPGVIRLIKLIVHEANKHCIPVSVCGEIAADPRFTALLLGLGVHELSIAARYIPEIKNTIRHTSIIYAKKLAEKALLLSTAQEILDLIHEEYRLHFPNDIFYNV